MSEELSELQEHADGHAFGSKPSIGLADVIDPQALLHRVEDLL